MLFGPRPPTPPSAAPALPTASSDALSGSSSSSRSSSSTVVPPVAAAHLAGASSAPSTTEGSLSPPPPPSPIPHDPRPYHQRLSRVMSLHSLVSSGSFVCSQADPSVLPCTSPDTCPRLPHCYGCGTVEIPVSRCVRHCGLSTGSSGSTSGSGKPAPADDTAGGAVSSAPVSTAGTGARDSVMGADTGGYGGDDGGTGTGGVGPSTSIVPSTQQL
jgi:hypothetical protein